MIRSKSKSRYFSGELGTFAGLALCLFGLFFWLDYRDITHDEISEADCANLNEKWQSMYEITFEFSDDLDVISFDCPTINSGMALGLRFLEETEFSGSSGETSIDFWEYLANIEPTLGGKTGALLAGLATYGDPRIDINPVLLKRGDPVEIAGVLVHEARHLAEGVNTHIPCSHDRQLTCDQRLSEKLSDGGAYSYSVLFYDRIIRHSDASSQAKRSAERLLAEVLDNRFNAVLPELRARYYP